LPKKGENFFEDGNLTGFKNLLGFGKPVTGKTATSDRSPATKN
jgi:hypothetical protein